MCALSDWINAEDSQCVTLKRGDTVVPWDDITKGAGACIRLEFHTAADVKGGLSYLTMVPLSHANLIKLCEKWEIDVGSPRVPVIAFQMGDGKKKSLETSLMIQEDRNSAYGLGILPLIQQVLSQQRYINPCSNLFLQMARKNYFMF